MESDPFQYYHQQQGYVASMPTDNTGASGSGQPPPDQQPVKGSSHQRNYQACIPCRRKKVKCDRGDVDNPDPGACARCRREGVICYFSATRRKTKTAADDNDEEDIEHMSSDPSDLRKRSSSAVLTPSEQRRLQQALNPPRTPGGGIGQKESLKRRGPGEAAAEAAVEPTAEEVEEEKIKTEETNQILRNREVFEPRDMMQAFHDTKELSAKLHPTERTEYQTDEDMIAHVQALDAWRTYKFVAEGLVSEHECISYVRYFYAHLAPLTAVTIPDFSHNKSHKALTQEEPVMCVAILAMASRYQKLAGRGAVLRAANIHDKLSAHLEDMINALVWGHEFSQNAPRRSTLPTSPDASAKFGALRSLGTIECLLMLSEWHARSLHFPANKGLQRLCVDDVSRDTGSNGSNGSNKVAYSLQNPSLQIKDDCQDPCLRSDRICWSMLNLAKALAYELEIMDRSAKFTEALQRRAENDRRLIFVFLTQTAGRLSIPMPLSYDEWESLLEGDRMEEKVKPMLTLTDISRFTDKEMQELRQDATLYFWYRLAGLFYHGNKLLFADHACTLRVVQENTYPIILEQLNELHEDWRVSMDQCTLIHPNMRLILDIEYHYMRVLGYNVALQAVVLRCVSPANSESDQATKPQTLTRYLGDDRKHIDNIIAGSQALLRSVVELGRTGALQGAPVRTFFRIIAVAVILLKTFSLGVEEDDASKSLGLLDDAASALSNNVIDDIHVAGLFALHMSKLTKRVRKRMVRINQGGAPAANSPSSSTAPPPKRRRKAHSRQTSSNTLWQRRGDPSFGLTDPTHPAAPLEQHDMPDPSVGGLAGPTYGQQQQQAPRGTDYFNVRPQQQYATATEQAMASASSGALDPLRGVAPMLPYDPLRPKISVMPPPTWSYRYGQMPVQQQANAFNSQQQPNMFDPQQVQQYQGGNDANNVFSNSGENNADQAQQEQWVPPEPPTFSSDAANDTPSSSAHGADNDVASVVPFPGMEPAPQSPWLALPLDPAIDAGADADVNSFGFGPDFGEAGDFLDVLLGSDGDTQQFQY